MKKEIFAEIPLTSCVEQAPENLSIRLQCTEINHGGTGFVFDLLEAEKTVLSAGLRATESLFISLYLQKITGLYLQKITARLPVFNVSTVVAGAWAIKMSTRLYSPEGGTRGGGEIWVEDGAIWVGYSYAGQLVSRAKLDEAQLAGLARMADAMDAIFGGAQ